VGIYFYLNVDNEIRRHVEQRFNDHYDEYQVRVQSARLVDNKGIEIRGLTITARDEDDRAAALIDLDEVLLVCDVSTEKLVRGDLQIQQVILRRPTLRATRSADGTWNVAGLLPLPKFSDKPNGPMPETIIEDATIKLVDHARGGAHLTLRDVNLRLKSSSSDPAVPGPLQITGELQTDRLGSAQISGVWDPASKSWNLRGTIQGLRISPELHDLVPPEFMAKLDLIRTLRANCQVSFGVVHDPLAEVKTKYDVEVKLAEGRIDDSRIPYPITDITTQLRLRNAGFEINELTATAGETTLRVNGHGEGFTATSPMELNVECRRLDLDQRWLELLPQKVRTGYHKFLPHGEIHADAKFSFDGERWHKELLVRCLDVSFSYYRLPYRIEQTTGAIQLVDQDVTFHLRGFAGSQAVRIEGKLSNPGPRATGWVELKGEGIPLDETLFQSLRGKAQSVVRSLRPQGTFDLTARLWRDDPTHKLFQHRMFVKLNGCTINFAKFPYPIREIRGTLESHNRRWTLHNLEGANDSGRIACRGLIEAPSEGGRMQLFFTGLNVPLDDELRDAMGKETRQFWNDMHLRGAVDLACDVMYEPQGKRLSLHVRAEPLGTGTSFQPNCFPYRFTAAAKKPGDIRLRESIRQETPGSNAARLPGVIVFRSGAYLPPHQGAGAAIKNRVDFRRLKLRHEQSEFTADGRCMKYVDGTWRFQLDRIAADRIRLDRDPQLVSALPDKLRRAVVKLKPTGPIHLGGQLEFSGSAHRQRAITSRWDVTLDTYGGSLDCGVKLDHLQGGVRLTGGFDGQTFRSQGELKIDSASCKGFYFTDIRGPMLLNGSEIILGHWGRRNGNQGQARHLSAKFLGGNVVADVWAGLGATPKFALRAGLSDANLETVSQEHISGKTAMKGKIHAQLQLSGTGRGINSLAGRGEIALREADVYELPVMVALLKILSVRQVDPTAFTRGDISFDIKANHLYFDKLDFQGDAISLHGKGEMDLDQHIKLKFYTTIGPGQFQIPLIKNLLGQASQQIMVIHVDGSLSNPKLTQEVFPNLNRALNRIGDTPRRGRETLAPKLETIRRSLELR
jgi:hypothetical protein